jgi:hypothetical protein
MLLQLRDYIKKGQTVSIEQLAREFHIDSQALQPMLDIWVNKGVVKKHDKKLSCKTLCSSCNINNPVYYHWID